MLSSTFGTLIPIASWGRSQPPGVTHTSAKIVLVGESGVGKTGLG
jgi:GTPase SAR1 family protein